MDAWNGIDPEEMLRAYLHTGCENKERGFFYYPIREPSGVSEKNLRANKALIIVYLTIRQIPFF